MTEMVAARMRSCWVAMVAIAEMDLIAVVAEMDDRTRAADRQEERRAVNAMASTHQMSEEIHHASQVVVARVAVLTVMVAAAAVVVVQMPAPGMQKAGGRNDPQNSVRHSSPHSKAALIQ